VPKGVGYGTEANQYLVNGCEQIARLHHAGLDTGLIRNRSSSTAFDLLEEESNRFNPRTHVGQ
jgi:hypothetical protein